MKKLKSIILLSVCLLAFVGCDKDFAEVNTNPYEINISKGLEPGLLFAGAQRVSVNGTWEGQNTIVQHFVLPKNTGATKTFNFNYDAGGGGFWSQYTSSLKAFGHILDLINDMPEADQARYVNAKSIVRIWKAYVFMNIVDQLGSVPYFDALKAYSEGEEYYYPKYDDAKVIYEDLEKEIKEALAALDPNGDFVREDLFYGVNGSASTNTAAAQVAQWKKLGNSILLRMGMRYSRYDAAKAERIVKEAFSGGVMESAADDVFVTYDGTLFTNTTHNGLITNNANTFFAAEPFVTKLKNTNDPRGKYLVAKFANPASPGADPNPNINLADQIGVPVGVDADQDLPGYTTTYSQMNVQVAVSRLTRTYWVRYSQTALLLAEAAHRGWISGGDAQAKVYYESAIKADMDRYALYVSDAQPAFSIPASISAAEQNAYLAHSDIAWDATKALNLINTQYWIVNIFDGNEAWNNFKRSGYPELKRNDFNNDFFLGDGSFGDGFARRYKYPSEEMSKNSDNYWKAVETIGGKDDNYVRIFWDLK